MKVKDLRHQAHRRVERRVRDDQWRGDEHRRGQSCDRTEHLLHRYSVINGSNVHSASVRNTTSNAARIPIHMIAVGSSGGAPSSAAVPRTPPIITGMMIGYNRMGSSTSRDRARTSMAANSVPTAQKPTVPSINSAIRSSGLPNID